MKKSADKQVNKRAFWEENPKFMAKRWKPGQSGNPKGRPPKAVCLTSQLKELLLSVPEIVDKRTGEINQKRGVELIALAWFKALLQGNPILLKEALNRLEGKVPQPITGKDEGPIKISLIEDLTDEELACIAARGRSGAVKTAASEE